MAIELPGRPLAGAANGIEKFFGGLSQASNNADRAARLKQLELAAAVYVERVKYLTEEIDQLRKLLGLPAYPGKTKIPAMVIHYAPLENRITINKGRRSGVKPQLPVIAGEGLVGVVQTAEENSAQVLLISSPQIRIGAVVNRQPAPFGIVRGESANKMTMEIADLKSTVAPGDVVLTSGLGELIPGGIPLGIISQKESDEEYGALRCQIFPYVLAGEVREVIVLR